MSNPEDREEEDQSPQFREDEFYAPEEEAILKEHYERVLSQVLDKKEKDEQ